MQTFNANPAPGPGTKLSRRSWFIRAALALILWLILWFTIEPAAAGIAGLLGLKPGSPGSEALIFFLYDTAKILLLLVLMVYVLAWLRAGLNTDRVRDYLSGKGKGAGYGLAALFGAVTPFCSCSSIPLFLGFTTAGIPLGITMAFLITSPLINEVAVVLLWGLLGWKFTLIYVGVGLTAGILGGMVMDTIKAGRWLQPYVLEAASRPPLRAFGLAGRMKPDALQRHDFAWSETRTIFLRVWRWVLVGVGVGALLHGFVPQEWLNESLGRGQWWSVPLAVAAGIPLYVNVTGIVPVMESLLLKGLPLGTTLAFCMSAVGASLPELIMLRQVMRLPLLAAFTGLLLVIFTLSGWLFNAVQPLLGL